MFDVLAPLSSVASHLRCSGAYSASRAVLFRCYSLLAGALGDADPRCAEVMAEQGDLLEAVGDTQGLNEAWDMYEAALGVQTEVGGAGSLPVARLRTSIGRLLVRIGQLDDAAFQLELAEVRTKQADVMMRQPVTRIISPQESTASCPPSSCSLLCQSALADLNTAAKGRAAKDSLGPYLANLWMGMGELSLARAQAAAASAAEAEAASKPPAAPAALLPLPLQPHPEHQAELGAPAPASPPGVLEALELFSKALAAREAASAAAAPPAAPVAGGGGLSAAAVASSGRSLGSRERFELSAPRLAWAIGEVWHRAAQAQRLLGSHAEVRRGACCLDCLSQSSLFLRIRPFSCSASLIDPTQHSPPSDFAGGPLVRQGGQHRRGRAWQGPPGPDSVAGAPRSARGRELLARPSA